MTKMTSLMTKMTHHVTILLVMAVLPSSVSADEAKAPASAPLGVSVMIFNEWGLRNAPKMVESAAEHGHRRVNFVITIHAQLDKDLGVLNYGLIRARRVAV